MSIQEDIGNRHDHTRHGTHQDNALIILKELFKFAQSCQMLVDNRNLSPPPLKKGGMRGI